MIQQRSPRDAYRTAMQTHLCAILETIADNRTPHDLPHVTHARPSAGLTHRDHAGRSNSNEHPRPQTLRSKGGTEGRYALTIIQVLRSQDTCLPSDPGSCTSLPNRNRRRHSRHSKHLRGWGGPSGTSPGHGPMLGVQLRGDVCQRMLNQPGMLHNSGVIPDLRSKHLCPALSTALLGGSGPKSRPALGCPATCTRLETYLKENFGWELQQRSVCSSLHRRTVTSPYCGHRCTKLDGERLMYFSEQWLWSSFACYPAWWPRSCENRIMGQ